MECKAFGCKGEGRTVPSAVMIQGGIWMVSRENIGTGLAESLLRDYFEDKDKMRKRIEGLKEFCGSMIIAHDTAKKAVMKMMHLETDMIAIGAFISTLSEDQQKFLRLMYKDRKNLQACSFKVGLSVSQLFNWKRDLLRMTLDYVKYDIREKDIYYPKKIVNMLEIIAKTIKFLEDIDPSHSVLDEDVFLNLHCLYDRYSRMYEAINDCLIHEDYSLQNKILATKIKNPNEIDVTIAEMCHVDSGTLSRYLKSARDEIMKKAM